MEGALLMTLFLLVFFHSSPILKKESEPEIEVIKEEEPEIKVNIKNNICRNNDK